VQGDGKAPMTVNPAIGIGFTPCGLPIDSAKPFGDNALLLVLFVPNRPAGFVHHFIGTDNFVSGKAQEIAEK
jgi:hypothetical protein